MTTEKLKTDLVIFVICAPTSAPTKFNILDQFSWAKLVLHSYYDYSSKTGQEALQTLGAGAIKNKHLLKMTTISDIFGLKNSDLVIYDADTEPSHHLLTLATAYGKPVIVSSSKMLSPPSYFSTVFSVVRPSLVGRVAKEFLTSFSDDWAHYDIKATRALLEANYVRVVSDPGNTGGGDTGGDSQGLA